MDSLLTYKRDKICLDSTVPLCLRTCYASELFSQKDNKKPFVSRKAFWHILSVKLASDRAKKCMSKKNNNKGASFKKSSGWLRSLQKKEEKDEYYTGIALWKGWVRGSIKKWSPSWEVVATTQQKRTQVLELGGGKRRRRRGRRRRKMRGVAPS